MTAPGDAAVAHWLAANRAAIAATHDAKRRLAARAALDATLARMRAAAPAASAPDLRAAVARQLAAPGRYDLAPRVVRSAAPSPWERFWSWIGDQWSRLWNATGARIHLGRTGGGIVGFALLALVLGVVLWALVRMLASVQIERERRRGVSQALAAGRSARALYLQACAAAAEGDYARAARILFVAAVTALDLRGTMRDDASATVGELRGALRLRDGALVSPFEAVAAPFVVAAYAERPVEAHEWERARDAYRDLTREEGA